MLPEDKTLPMEPIRLEGMRLTAPTSQEARIPPMVLIIQTLGTPPTELTLQEETLPTLPMSPDARTRTMELMDQAMAMLPMEPITPEPPILPMLQDSRILPMVAMEVMVLNTQQMGTSQILRMLLETTTQPMLLITLEAGTLLMGPTTQ